MEEPLSASANPFRYTGRRYDPETGLYHYRARYYDAGWGRFLETDPVLYADQMNLYAYVGNNPLNATDPTGMCIRQPDGSQIGICGTNQASTDLLERAKSLSPETAEANALAEYQGVYVPFTFDPDQVGSFTDARIGLLGNTISQEVFVGGSSYPVSAVDTTTGEVIDYVLGPLESTVHELGGHVRDNLSGPRRLGFRDPQTPNVEVNALAAENNLRASMGVPVVRRVYSGPSVITVTPSGPQPPRTIEHYLERNR